VSYLMVVMMIWLQMAISPVPNAPVKAIGPARTPASVSR
jgi:hypothetical protein